MKNPVIKIYTMIKTLVVNKHDQNITMIKNDTRYYIFRWP